jgi:hypothetical protein
MSIKLLTVDEALRNQLKRWDGQQTTKTPAKKSKCEQWTEHAMKSYNELVTKGMVRLISIDPGREELFHSASINPETGEFEEHRFKRTKYIEVSLRNKMKAFHVKNRTKEISRIEGLLAMNGGWKARTPEDYRKVFEVWTSGDISNYMINHYCNVEYALWKMRLFRRRESVLYQRFKKMIGPRTTEVNGSKVKVCILIGYGHAKLGTSGKGEEPVPTARNAILLKKYLKALNIPSDVVSVWEYLTSQMCHACHQRMHNIKMDGRIIRGLKLCKSTTCCQEHNPAFRNRDGNAARNILFCLMAMVNGQPRPSYLCPAKTQSYVVKQKKKKPLMNVKIRLYPVQKNELGRGIYSNLSAVRNSST